MFLCNTLGVPYLVFIDNILRVVISVVIKLVYYDEHFVLLFQQ